MVPATRGDILQLQTAFQDLSNGFQQCVRELTTVIREGLLPRAELPNAPAASPPSNHAAENANRARGPQAPDALQRQRPKMAGLPKHRDDATLILQVSGVKRWSYASRTEVFINRRRRYIFTRGVS